MSPADINTILYRLDAQDRKLDRIEDHATKTNGRVGRLELWRAHVEGARWAVSWVPPFVTAVLAAAIAALVTATIM